MPVYREQVVSRSVALTRGTSALSGTPARIATGLSGPLVGPGGRSCVLDVGPAPDPEAVTIRHRVQT